MGGPDIYVREGSSVTLECIVAESSNPVYIAWQFNRGDVPGSRLSVLGQYSTVHCKKVRSAIFPSAAGKSQSKLSRAGNYLIIPHQGEFG